VGFYSGDVPFDFAPDLRRGFDMASRASSTDSIAPAFTEVTAWQARSFRPRGRRKL